VELSREEAALVHDPFVQRMRNIRQVGFSHLPFPGANHSRFAHSLGVMHIAGRAFDRAYRNWEFDQPDARARFRAVVRLAAMSHDLGHAPYSHCTEFAMPPVGQLEIPWYRVDGERRATHEDYTIAVLAHPRVVDTIGTRFPCTAKHVAALISHDVRPGDDFFFDGGFDHRKLLSQIISSELDADRLDYLVRDAYYTGANYGTVDVAWILSNLSAHAADGRLSLALDSSALYAFEDFLVSRHHMFLQVYFHHKSVVYEEMLKRYVTQSEGEWQLPADLDRYLYEDDVSLDYRLRQSDDTWARRIVERREYRRVVERHGSTHNTDLQREMDRLDHEGIDYIHSSSTGRLSRYALGRRRRNTATDIFVKERLPGQRATRIRGLRDAATVFQRYADEHNISRLYVAPEDRERAWRVLGIRAEG
jgi:HD superfamily phosphohydrolase